MNKQQRQRQPPQGTVYLLCFSQPLKHARHYLGFSVALDERLEEHREGRGARLTQVIAEQGITFQLARTWTGTRATERALKNQKNAPRLCPLCNPLAAGKQATGRQTTTH